MTARPSLARRIAGALAIGAALVLALPGLALAHPLGNFTINHYAGIRVGQDRILIDVVIDQAEIPTFTERQRMDTNGDGTVDDVELEAERFAACGRLASSLALSVDGVPIVLTAYAAGVSLPQGTAGLSTLRTVCEYEASPPPLDRARTIAFDDASYPQRIGWREIRVEGDGITIAAGQVTQTDHSTAATSDLGTDFGSHRLTAYPTGLLAQAPATRSVSFLASPGGPSLAPLVVADARPLPGVAQPRAGQTAASSSSTAGTASAVSGAIRGSSSGGGPSPIPGSAAIPAGAIPGGVQDQIAGLLETKDLDLLALVGSLALAVGLGALHAVSPGHGKTVMAAYLVGSRGSARHAVALGLTVTVSHTLGVLGLAAVTLFASSLIAPEQLYPILGLASGAMVIGIGCWLLLGRLRILGRRRAERDHAADHAIADARAEAREDDHPPEHLHADSHPKPHPHESGGQEHDHDGEEHDHDGQEHDHDGQEHDHDGQEHDPDGHEDGRRGEHSHGGIRHSHVPLVSTDLTWRSLFTLGLAGGLVPSASALLLLLGSLAANRAAYGLVLVVAFGAGMAIVLSGIGLALVVAGRYVERMPHGARFTRTWELLPVATAVIVVVAGIYLTSQAVRIVL